MKSEPADSKAALISMGGEVRLLATPSVTSTGLIVATPTPECSAHCWGQSIAGRGERFEFIASACRETESRFRGACWSAFAQVGYIRLAAIGVNRAQPRGFAESDATSTSDAWKRLGFQAIARHLASFRQTEITPPGAAAMFWRLLCAPRRWARLISPRRILPNRI
jgi:hypothetical protein